LVARTGGQVLIDQLRIHGTDHIFGVPGESYLAALDALHDARNAIKFVICRQEGGASNMAEAYGKLMGRPGVCFVTRGPGATNASIGVHTGFQDSTPMIVLVGQVARDQEEREAFQEIDYRRMFGPMTKWVAQIEDARRIPELVSQAFHRAMSGRPGPVVLALPEDMLADVVEVADAGPYKVVRGAPDPEDMARLATLLADASSPLVMLGGGGWTKQATHDIRAFIDTNELPVDNAKIVRTKGGVSEVTDGPFVEIKEIVAGYYIVECAGIGRATQIAGKLAEAEFGLVEVRQMTSQPRH